ncbi:MAG: RDD family protein [Sulfurimonas sp.]|uniref:RDD family protein n=1 Tax=Sulfurimonas sp. TaxID=2022749 RepID=UPI0025E74A7E|nr:RDD family protein [Sulfurimonas sp.]MCK9490744.1 RDD family protein [Sulfurimonas sp.]
MDTSKLRYAGFWIRFGATMIDAIILMMIVMPLMYFFYGDQLLYNDAFIMGPADFVINYVFPLVATVLFWKYKSATPGKMALKLKVVDAKTGDPLSVGQSIGRYFAYILSAIPLLLGYFWVAWDSKKQAWHDKLAGSVVVREELTTEDVNFSG